MLRCRPKFLWPSSKPNTTRGSRCTSAFMGSERTRFSPGEVHTQSRTRTEATPQTIAHITSCNFPEPWPPTNPFPVVKWCWWSRCSRGVSSVERIAVRLRIERADTCSSEITPNYTIRVPTGMTPTNRTAPVRGGNTSRPLHHLWHELEGGQRNATVAKFIEASQTR